MERTRTYYFNRLASIPKAGQLFEEINVADIIARTYLVRFGETSLAIEGVQNGGHKIAFVEALTAEE